VTCWTHELHGDTHELQGEAQVVTGGQLEHTGA
jgi:hypothetical protein